MKMVIGLMAAALALFTTGAVADDRGGKDQPQKTTEQKFEQLDRDKDNRLSRNEAQSDESLSAQFGSIDKNTDGYVSKSEYTAMTDTRPPTDKTQPGY